MGSGRAWGERNRMAVLEGPTRPANGQFGGSGYMYVCTSTVTSLDSNAVARPKLQIDQPGEGASGSGGAVATVRIK